MGCTIATLPQPLTGCAYCKEISLFIGYAFCQVSIGAALMMAFCYSSHTKDYHGGLCTIGWQLLMAEGTLIMVYTHCNPLIYHHRRSTHMFMQILGLTFILSGSVLIMYIISNAGLSYKMHGWIGIAAFVFTLISALAGPIAALKYEQVKIVHGALSIPTLILSTMAFLTGAMSDKFKQYAGSTAIILLIMLSAYYALFLIVSASIKVFQRCLILNKEPEPGWCSYGGKPAKAKTNTKREKKTNADKESSSKAENEVRYLQMIYYHGIMGITSFVLLMTTFISGAAYGKFRAFIGPDSLFVALVVVCVYQVLYVIFGGVLAALERRDDWLSLKPGKKPLPSSSKGNNKPSSSEGNKLPPKQAEPADPKSDINQPNTSLPPPQPTKVQDEPSPATEKPVVING